MTVRDLPAEKGTCVLLAFVPQMKRIEIGRLGEFNILPGFYAYVGSALIRNALIRDARVVGHCQSANVFVNCAASCWGRAEPKHWAQTGLPISGA